jgi:hypothetical protein
MKSILQIVRALMPHVPFDALGVGVIDFKHAQSDYIEVTRFHDELNISSEPKLYFDIASLTKPLTNSLAYFLKPEVFNEEMKLCLSHRGGLPAWGLLSSESWRQQILSYPIIESETLYSDFSALRVLLELEKQGIDVKALCQQVWDQETLFWKDLPFHFPTTRMGFRNGVPNYGQVHDPNAWVIDDFCSHAGLFSTVDGLCRTLLNYQQKTNFIDQVKTQSLKDNHRFIFGWDRVVDPQNTLAGNGCGSATFGHLGFTGASIWIDPDKMLGHVILSNAVKYHWFDKQGLNDLRRAIGEIVWRG